MKAQWLNFRIFLRKMILKVLLARFRAQILASKPGQIKILVWETIAAFQLQITCMTEYQLTATSDVFMPGAISSVDLIIA
jgi:hypothetical protein